MTEQKEIITPENLKILVCCHKPTALPDDPYLLPIHAGAALSNMELEMQRDDMANGEPCDNISEKNPNYCELTALYWAWKNLRTILPTIEYIGLNHYRRYFAFQRSHALFDWYPLRAEELTDYRIDSAVLSQMLAQGKTIVAKKMLHPQSVFDEYAIAHNGRDLRELIAVVHELEPDFDQVVIDTLLCSNAFSRYNMFVTKWDIFDEYCGWLFSVLKSLEERIDISNYSAYQARIFGFMSERLWNIWLTGMGVDTAEVPILKVTDKRAGGRLPRPIHVLRRTVGYSISRYSKNYAQKLYSSLLSDDPRP